MKILLAVAVLYLCSPLAAAAGTLEELTPYFSSRYFTWQEEEGGRRILKERGPLFAAGVVAESAVSSSRLSLRGRAELFGGQVWYKGETQAPDSEPVRTQVGYIGVREELDVAFRSDFERGRFEPFLGLGHRWWLRDLQNSTSEAGTPVTGYTENWQTLYGRAGARGRFNFRSDLALFLEGGAKYPFYTGNSVDFSNSGVTTFYPRPRLSAFGEAGAAFRNARVSMTYEGFRFGRSPVRKVQGTSYLQPESSSDLIGLSVGWNFN